MEAGWSGLIIIGAVRDVAALATLDLGLKALATNPRNSGKAATGEVDIPVSFGGVTFAVRDTVYCDTDGIVLLS